jgi:hypothetical protein
MKFDEFKIKQLCDKYYISNYTIENGIVNVNGSVDLREFSITQIKVKFGTVTGNFLCNNNPLKTLDNAPNIVGGSFRCAYNKLTSLEGSPKEVGGSFDCNGNKLTNLKGSPKKVGGDFHCWHNKKLISLEGAPDLIEGRFDCRMTPVYSIFQSADPGLIDVFNMVFSNGMDLPLIEYWFSIIKKPLTDQAIKEIKKYYSI